MSTNQTQAERDKAVWDGIRARKKAQHDKAAEDNRTWQEKVKGNGLNDLKAKFGMKD